MSGLKRIYIGINRKFIMFRPDFRQYIEIVKNIEEPMELEKGELVEWVSISISSKLM